MPRHDPNPTRLYAQERQWAELRRWLAARDGRDDGANRRCDGAGAAVESLGGTSCGRGASQLGPTPGRPTIAAPTY
jgi:hypothetical protein